MTNVSKIKAASFCWALVFSLPILSLYMLDNGVGLPAIVMGQVFYSVFTVIGEVPTGVFADRFGQKQSMIIGYITNAIGGVVFLLMPSALGLYLGYSIFAFGDTFISGSKEALLYESSHDKEKYQKNLSLLLSYEILGFGASAVIAGIALQKLNANSFIPLLMISIAAKLTAAFFALGLKNVYTPIQDKTKGSQAFKIVKKSFKLFRLNRVLAILALVTVLTLNGEYFMYSVYQPYFIANNVPGFFVGSVLAFGAALNFLLTKYAYKLEHFMRLQTIILVLNLALAATYIGMAIFVSPIALVGLFIAMNGLYNLQIPVISDYINSHASSDIRATVLSGIGLSKQFVQLFVRVILGILVGAIGISKTLGVQGTYLIIGAVISFFVISSLGDTKFKHKA